MRAAIAAIRRRDPGRIIVAVPVASRSAMLSLYGLVDEVACLAVPEEFRGVGAFYQDFHQLTDREVINLLAGYSPRPAGVKVHQTK